jgi:hypothetical protein
MPEIYLAGLNLIIQNPVEITLGNTITLNVPLSYLNGIFTYETVEDELRFFVSRPNEAMFNLNLAYGIVQANGKALYIDALEQMALFVTGVADRNVFSNLSELQANIIANGGPSGPVVQNIRNCMLALVAGSGIPPYAGLMIGIDGRGYCTTYNVQNICGEVYRQIPENRKRIGSLVFEAGDVISFNYTFDYLNRETKSNLYIVKLNLV